MYADDQYPSTRDDDGAPGNSAQRELAELLEAVPASLRADILWAALQMESSGTLERSYIVGQHRARFWDWLQEVQPGLAVDSFRLALIAHGTPIYAAVRGVNRANGVEGVEAALWAVMTSVEAALRQWNDDHPE